MTYFLEFVDADDQRLKNKLAEGVKFKHPIPVIPTTGDTVMIEQQIFLIIHRHIVYSSEDTTVLCYCREADEDTIRKHCGQ